MFSFEDLLALEDVFVGGLGFAVAGAYLLGRGLLPSPGALARRSRPDDAAIVAAAQARVDALTGLIALALGFALHALGFVLVVGGAGPGERGVEGALVAVLCAAAGAGAVLAVWKGVRERATRSLLIEVARHDPLTGERGSRPAADRLRAFGHELGYPLGLDEATPDGAAVYARRVFGVTEVEPAQEPFPPS